MLTLQTKNTANTGQIRLRRIETTAFPIDVESVIEGDFYTLHAPLGHALGKCMSEGRLLRDGDFHLGIIRLVSPGERIKVSLESPFRALVVEIPGPKIRQVFDRLDYRPGHGQSSSVEQIKEPNSQVARLAGALTAAPDFEDNCRQLFIDGLAHSLIACLLDSRSRYPSGRGPGGHRTLSNEEFARCCDYAEAQLQGHLDICEWGEVVGMAATEFNRRFREHTGLSPYAWFMNLRIDRAKQLLQDRRQDITEVALSLGFCSQSHFSDAFRRRVGRSPARWRAEVISAGF